LTCLSELANDGDVSAIEYVAEAARHVVLIKCRRIISPDRVARVRS